MNIYIQIIGPDKKKNESFIEKMANKKHNILNNFVQTTEMNYDPKALENYFIYTDDIDISHNEKVKWMEFYYNNNSITWVKEF